MLSGRNVSDDLSLGTCPADQPAARTAGVGGAVHPGGASSATVRQQTRHVGVLFEQHQPAWLAVTAKRTATFYTATVYGRNGRSCVESFHVRAFVTSEPHGGAGLGVNAPSPIHRDVPHLAEKERGSETAPASPNKPNHSIVYRHSWSFVARCRMKVLTQCQIDSAFSSS